MSNHDAVAASSISESKVPGRTGHSCAKNVSYYYYTCYYQSQRNQLVTTLVACELLELCQYYQNTNREQCATIIQLSAVLQYAVTQQHPSGTP